MIKPVFELKEKEAIDLIRDVVAKNPTHQVFALNSTGKDSMLVNHLCELSGCSFQTVFNNTSLDCADTYKMVKRHPDWIVTNPHEGFYQYIKRMQFIPTRFGRGCCRIFKEGNFIEHFKDIDNAICIMGVRNDESAKRSTRQDIDGNPSWKETWIGVNPIRKWTELEVWLYTLYHGLEINDKYKKGYKRVGCAIACPFYTKTTWYLDKYWYPKQYKRWQKILHDDFINGEKWHLMNCTLDEYYRYWNGGLVREKPTDEVVTEFMEYKGLTDRNLALQYFGKNCKNCQKSIRKKNEIAMNLKLYGRNINQFLCKKCLMKQEGLDSEQWNNYIEQFKAQNCELF